MRKIAVLIFAFIIMCGITGCVSPNYGNQNLTSLLIQQSVILGKSTKQDLLDTLGKPATISITTGSQAVPNNLSKAEVKEIWNYYKMTKEGFSTMKMLMLAIYLDKDGKVLDYVITEKE